MTDLPSFADQTDFANASRGEARELLASTYERLAHGAENSTWRNLPLQGADELCGHLAGAGVNTASLEVAAALTVEQLFDSIAYADLTVTLTKPRLLHMLATGSPDGVETTGDNGALRTLFGILDTADSQFAMVTP